MKVLVTGHDGYIGSVMIPMLQAAGHEIVGIDTFFYSDGDFDRETNGILSIQKDIRDLVPEDFDGFEAVIHLAALSNDPLGELNTELTYKINHWASVRMAQLAKEAGVQRFLYASTCSVYGLSSPDEVASEASPLRPLTSYAISKVLVEADLAELADDEFSPVFLRNATAYGWSPRFRADLVLNNLVCWAHASGEIRILSDGTPWRPIVHVQDIAHAFLAALAVPREVIHKQAFNVGHNEENYQVHHLAAIVKEVFHDCKITYDEHGGPDRRSYRVDFSKIVRELPVFKPKWNARRGVDELRAAFKRVGLTQANFAGSKYVRLARLKSLLGEGLLDLDLRWKNRVISPVV